MKQFSPARLTPFVLMSGLLVPSFIAGAATPVAAPAMGVPAGGAPAAMVSPVEKLDNGVLFVPSLDRSSPRVAVSLLLGVGSADETARTAGWRNLLVSAMLRAAPQGYAPGATKTEKEEALTRAAGELGATISATVGDDVVEFFVVGDSARGVDALKLALALIQTPTLSDENLDATRERQLDRVGAQDLDVEARIESAIRSQVFRDKNGDLVAYGLPDNGTKSSLTALDNAALRDLQKQLASAPLTVSAAGDVDVAGMRAVLQTLPARETKAAPQPSFALPKAGAPPLIVRELPTEGAYVFVSYPLANFNPADGPTLRVLVAALSDAKGARLPARLSGDNLIQGAPQASTVSAQWLDRRYASEVLLTAQTDSQSVDAVKNVLLDEVRKMREGTLSATELERAKAFARGDWALDRQFLRNRAFLSGLPTALGAPPDATWPDRLQAVTAADVKRVANLYFKPYAVALVMPKS